MKRWVYLMALAWSLLAVAGIPVPSAAQTTGTVQHIVVEGAQRVEPDTVRSYLLIQVGDPFDPVRIDRSLKSLYATGLFADVSINRKGDSLIVKVTENPIINRIAFEGNRHIEDKTLQAEVTLRPRVIYTRTKVQNDVQRILTIYRQSGRFAATVDPKVIQLPQNRVDLVFEISEGDPTVIEKIRFVGNHAFSDSTLREHIRTKETRWYRFFSSDDTYDPDRLTLDRELLRRYYLSEGYADFRVQSAVAELSPDRKKFFLTFTLEEGKRYKFGDIKLTTKLRDLKVDELKSVVDLEKGDWYNQTEVEKTIDTLTDKAGNLGYAFVDVRPEIDRDRKKHVVNITFAVDEGPRVFVERIDITGNVRTLDRVIRREFRFVEGDAFNAAKLRRSRQRIQDLDFFKKVDIQRVPGSSPDKAVIKVKVEEKSTGNFSIGAGYSTTNGPLGDVTIRERNLLGRGEDLRLSATLAARKSQIDLGFTEPYFLGREIAAGFDLFHTTQNRQNTSSYDYKATGGDVRATYPLSDKLSQGWKYTLKRTKITNVDPAASIYVKAQEGQEILSEVSHSLTYDARDSKISPTDGYILRLTNDVAGLGGTAHYLRTRVDAATYYPIADQWVLSLSGSTGYIVGLGEDVRLADRFFIGGDDLRGFATYGVGPRDITTGDALGGQWMYTGTLEMNFPVGLPSELGITGRMFSDFGSTGKISDSGTGIVDSGSLRLSAGAGISWISPFGPIGVDVGFPILKKSYDKTEVVRINFGTRF